MLALSIRLDKKTEIKIVWEDNRLPTQYFTNYIANI